MDRIVPYEIPEQDRDLLACGVNLALRQQYPCAVPYCCETSPVPGRLCDVHDTLGSTGKLCRACGGVFRGSVIYCSREDCSRNVRNSRRRASEKRRLDTSKATITVEIGTLTVEIGTP